jgi:hypothetical protein
MGTSFKMEFEISPWVVGAAVGAAVTYVYVSLSRVFSMPHFDRAASVQRGSAKGGSEPGIVFYQLGARPGAIGSYSGFCLKVEATLAAGGFPFSVKEAFRDQPFPPRGKAPFILHTAEDGSVTTVSGSDAIVTYLLTECRGMEKTPARAVLPDEEVRDPLRRAAVRFAQRTAEDRLYFVGMQWVSVEPEGVAAASAAEDKGGMPWPFRQLFNQFLRVSMATQCGSAAGGIGRIPWGEIMIDVERDLDSLNDLCEGYFDPKKRQWLSGETRPCSAEVALWSQVAVSVFEGKDSPLGKALNKREHLREWVEALAEYLFPDRVAAIRERAELAPLVA